LTRDRATLLTGAALIAVALLAWVVVVWQATAMASPPPAAGDDMAMADGAAGLSAALASAVAFLASWAVMMAAMMLPSATPMIGLYGAMYRRRPAGQPGVPTALFALVYLAVWAALGVPVFLGTLAVGVAAASPTVAPLLPYGVALVLVAAGLYQFTPLKRVCLRQCQSPLGFLMGHWRSGRWGMLRLALEHAGYCVGCCWALMIVLVAAGAMGLQWVLLIAVAVFAEKLIPGGQWTARAVGVALVLLAVLLAVRPDLAATLRGQAM
jgi:predicted metal-binding membrane protein